MFVILAVIIDLLVGDPAAMHPVSLMGKLASVSERLFRKLVSNEYAAGFFTLLFISLISAVTAYALIFSVSHLNTAAGFILSSFLFSFSFAVKSMMKYTVKIKNLLLHSDIDGARKETGSIVGRKTDRLSPDEVIRATVESTAESLTDGFLSPVFYGCLGFLAGGPAAGCALAYFYRSINTMDSMFGHKNQTYLKFGMTSARLDDILNFIPSRLSFLFILTAALIRKENVKNCIAIFIRDRNRHPSPNAGQSESAFAGALGILLGGENIYENGKEQRPVIGSGIEKISPDHIDRANALFILSSLIFSIIAAGLIHTAEWLF